MNNDEQQKKIWQSQGLKLSRPEAISEPRNKIEEALRRTTVPLSPKYEPLKASPRSKNRFSFLKRTIRLVLFGLVLIIILAALSYGGMIVFKHFQSGATMTNAALIRDVGKTIELPSGETPTIATIVDLTPLAGQPFFKDAAVGDKVLIFSKAGEAILYRPSTDKVIVVAPLSLK